MYLGSPHYLRKLAVSSLVTNLWLGSTIRVVLHDNCKLPILALCTVNMARKSLFPATTAEDGTVWIRTLLALWTTVSLFQNLQPHAVTSPGLVTSVAIYPPMKAPNHYSFDFLSNLVFLSSGLRSLFLFVSL